MLAVWIVGSLLALAWIHRVVDAGLGMPSIANIAEPQWDTRPDEFPTWPRVSIIVPALNEAETIAEALTRLLRLDYPNFEVIAVNDRSTDRTGELMEQVAASPEAHGLLRVLHITELPPRWLGKVHAMHEASKLATGDWLLFTDGDILYQPETLRRTITYATRERADHLVLFPWMIMKSVGERMVIAFFQTMFAFGHRPWKVADPKAKDFIGIGAFNLIRRSTYDAMGGHEPLRMEVVDDMKLGKLVKDHGFRQRNVFGGQMISLRWGKSGMAIIRNFTKNFFAVMSYQTWRSVASVFALLFFNLTPFVGLFLAHGWARLPFGLVLLCMAIMYAGMKEHSGVPPQYVLLHPVSAVLIAYALAASTFHTLRQDGVNWRGTHYPLEELRKGLV